MGTTRTPTGPAVATDGGVGLRGPSLGPARAWVAASPQPSSAPWSQVLGAQRDDGSWGAADDWPRRALPTLWTASTLAELDHLGELDRAGPPAAGAGPVRRPAAVDVRAACAAALHFLGDRALTDEGVFSRDGTPAGVLACYVAIAATTFLLGGRTDLAAPQVDWILRYQDVRVQGRSRRGDPDVYHPGLATRYGGCLASTSCVIGVVKAGRALRLWRDLTDPRDDDRAAQVRDMLHVVRGALLERELMYTHSHDILPLGTRADRAADWLAPTFPLDWRTDLVEVVGQVAGTGPPDARMQPALDHLAQTQLPTGGWPLRRTFWPSGFPPLEPRSRAASRLATLRVLDALTPLGE
ncbi:hypothetical protein [Cellulomonas fimi]|uniref:Uncharacterized protein n=1 Tax=Cellulomonas fimi (strain ATCC 484 / DSM 20113 / JCM 1341 / CCUG 24087 / LMG 16345 / NBRC 15513 / NCIMB 8980 / NCTC 7547 / NRS-133) TaxID=590998 RepID=F4GZV2_CELFA|nr:hypothetical protein [Cellulomonas fimi]AEE47268.1 hypothetical protein Celf_3154 [Cellulomonas fimi ATCC 484]NNH06982.1 hypothetical protein [Cellulomonas fimi]VEH35768.1 Uncharacterised protein [Cellulomonas fimi]